MKASQIMTRNPVTVTSAQTVAEAVKIMSAENCGIVPVIAGEDRQTVVGLVTDRDIALRACAEGCEGPETPVSVVMTQNLFCVAPGDDVSRVRQVMEDAGVRRVPVVEEDNTLVGIISFKDLADNLSQSTLGHTDETILAQPPNN